MDLLVVTGLSGAGKSLAVNVLEDIGDFCIDNIPAGLGPRLLEFAQQGENMLSKVAVVLDVNEMHPFQYDIYESGQLPLVKGKLDTAKRTVIKTANTLSDMESRAEDYIQFKIMKKFYGRNAALYLSSEKIFYRPAVEMEIIYKGKYPNMRYAYLDEFAVESEHVLGLKYRVDNNF